MSLTEHQNQIHELIRQETNLSDRLLELLQSENQALSTNNPEAIQQIASDKQLVIDSLESLGRQREILLQQAGFNNDKNGIESFLEQCNGDLDKDWQRLIDVIAQCQRQNEIIIPPCKKCTFNPQRPATG